MLLEDTDQHSPTPAATLWFGLLAAAGVALWWFNTTSFVADDSYFYLVIARNLAVHGQQSFSNIFPTNGFHPLWGYVLAAYSYFVHLIWPSALESPRYAVPLATVILAGIGVQSWRLAQRLELDPLVVSGLVVGFNLTTGVLYSEGPLFFLLLLTLLCAIAGDPQATMRRPLWIGLLAGAIVLARLDAVFLVGLILLDSLWRSESRGRTLVAWAVCGLVVGVYVLSNMVYFGGAMPISGWMKGSFPHVYLKGFTWRGIQTDLGGYGIVFGWIPLAFGAAVWAAARNATSLQRRMLALLWCGTAMHCLYVVLFTRSHTVWPWYYVQAIVLAALAAGVAIQQSIPLVNRRTALAVISMLAIVGYAEKLQTNRTPAVSVVDFLKANGIHGETMFLSDWPGAVAFYTDNNVLAADMLTFSRRLYEQMRGHSNAFDFLLAECERRGNPIRHIIFVGNNWLVWNPDTQELTFNDPRAYPTLVPIGVLRAQQSDDGEWKCANGVRIWFTPSHNGARPHDATDRNESHKLNDRRGSQTQAAT